MQLVCSQFEVIVFAVLLASSSEQQCPDKRAHFQRQVKSSNQVRDKNVTSQYDNKTFRTNDWVVSIDSELNVMTANQTNDDQPAWVATLDLRRDYILWKDEMV